MLASVQFPLEEPISEMEEAVQKLQQCETAELRRSRKYHRRAVQALQKGSYESLSESTRERLLKRFLTNLEALNKALGRTDNTTDRDDSKNRPPSTSSGAKNTGFRFGNVVTWFW